MDFSLTDEQQMFRDMFRGFATKEVAKIAKHTDESEEPPLELLNKAAAQGFLAAAIPEDLGGAALDPLSYTLMLEEIGKTDLQELIALVQESRPMLSQEIIRFLSRSRDNRTVTFLANIVAYKSVPVKLAAIKALGQVQTEAADKVLLGFLSDGNEEIRVGALQNMKKTADKQVIFHLIEAIKDKGFARKSAREKAALFGALGRTDSEEACSFLREILAKVPFLPNPKHTELCLHSIAALEEMNIPSSLEALKKGAKRRHQKIRRACLRAIQSKSQIVVSYTGRTVR